MCWRRAAFGSLPPDAPVEARLPFLAPNWADDTVRRDAVSALLSRADAGAALHATSASAKPPALRDLIVLFCALHLPDAADAGLMRARLADVTRLATAFDPHAASSRARLYHGGHALATGAIADAIGLWRAWTCARSCAPWPPPGRARAARPRPCRRRGGGRGGPARRAALAGGG
jgi:hypothetical protein